MWSTQQENALKAIRQWLRNGEQQVFRLFGYAGTGKTTLAKAVAADVGHGVIFASFTGKAALVLRQKGCEGARTIHSLIYRPEENPFGPPTFVLNDDSDAVSAPLIIVDECSMVDHALGRDLLSFGTPILVLGDPGQLPPVSGTGFFTAERPDFLLDEIHRQARNNPIIRLSMTVRNGGFLQPGRYGESEVIAKGFNLDADRVMRSDQILVGRNATRISYNMRFRKVAGREGQFPYRGDKLVCLRNDHDKKLLNGGLWFVDEMIRVKGSMIGMHLVSDDGESDVDVKVRPEFFTGQEGSLEWGLRKSSDEFTFGYALTVHKAQGSQWNDVIVFDESSYFREHRAKQLYTAITRAAEKVTVVL